MERLKHSGIGIAAFVGSLLSGIAIFILTIISIVVDVSTPGGMTEDSLSAMIIGLLMILTLFGCFISLGLGVGGFFQKDRKILYSILGTAISAATIVAVGFIFLLGLLLG